MSASFVYVVTSFVEHPSAEFRGSAILGAFATLEGAVERVRASFWGAEFELFPWGGTSLDEYEGYTAFVSPTEWYEIERVSVQE